MRTSTPFLLGSAAALAVAAPSLAAEREVQSQHHRILAETVADGLEHPWGLAFLPDGRFLVTERNEGRLRIGTREGEWSDPVAGVPGIFRYEGDTPRSQAGLFDVELHPEFEDNRLVYLSLSKPTDRGTGTAVVRGRLVEDAENDDNGGGPRLEDVETVFEMNEDDQDSSGLHFGGRMTFHPEDGTLFLTIGERRNISRSQDPHDHAGAIIRIADDGGVPDDNPFVDSDDADEKVYSYGHRNPQGIAFDRATGELWVNDHGPLGGDEINRVEPGRNYGWPFITGGKDYSGAPLGVGTEHEDMESPAHVFEETVAPSGLVFYDSALFERWQGDMLNGGLTAEGIVRVSLEDGRVIEEEWIDLGRRVRDVQVAADGSIWVITEHEDAEVLRLTPADNE